MRANKTRQLLYPVLLVVLSSACDEMDIDPSLLSEPQVLAVQASPRWIPESGVVYVPAEAAPRLSARVSDFVALDLRVDKTWTFDTWSLGAYVEVSNVTNRANVEAVGYNYDYSRRADITSLPIVPSLGVRASF